MTLLPSLILVALTATVLVAIMHRARLPSLLGFLLTGLLVGPIGLGLVTDSEEIHVFAEVGVVLLMFTIGLEISLADLVRMGRKVVGGGLAQIGATTVAFALLAVWVGYEPRHAITVGLLIAASSTALVLRVLGDRGDLATPHGQLALAVLLMQDFAVVALMLVLPMLADSDASFDAIALAVGQAAVFAVGIFVGARFAFPWVLRHIVALRSREVFLMATLLVVSGTAWVAEHAGLSLALGAFIAGLVVSESDFSHQMFAEILPFRDVFNGLFFVSIGLLLRPEILFENMWLIAGCVICVLAGKFAIMIGVAKAFRLPWGETIMAAVALSQVGEFGLVLGQLARSLELIDPTEHGFLIAVSVATMTLTPLLLIAARSAIRGAGREEPVPEVEGIDAEFADHVIVVGFGVNGRNVARALGLLEVPFVIVEMNAHTVALERASGLPIIYGDATRPALLHHLGIERARALVSAVSDAAATRDIIANAHHANPNMQIIARTRFVAEIEPLFEIGATQVVPEEFETSIELVARIMATYGASNRAIEEEKRRLRQQHYTALLGGRWVEEEQHPMSELLAALEVEKVIVDEASLVVSQTLRDVDLRAKTGATIIAILRAPDAAALTPSPDFVFRAGDVAYVAGDARALRGAARMLAPDAVFAP